MAFQIVRNDITKVEADAIVNTANPEPIYAEGTDSAIYRAAGKDKLLEERRKIGRIETGQVAVTPAFALSARYIIHTVGPAWRDGNHGEREAVRQCYENSLVKAGELGCESIAFPLIATGTYGFPKADALQIAVSVFSEFLAESDMQIILVVFDDESFVLSGKIFSGVDAYIDENYVSDHIEKEYGSAPAPGAALPMSDASRRRPFLNRQRRGGTDPVSGFLLAAEDAVQMPESTAERDAVQKAPETRSLDELMSQIAETWQESLFRLIDEKGFTDVEVYKRANVDRKLFSKIRSNTEYQPKKITAVSFALALNLNLDETKDLLGRAGYALSPSSRFDLIIQYFIEHGVYDTYTINLALFEHEQPLLGG